MRHQSFVVGFILLTLLLGGCGPNAAPPPTDTPTPPPTQAPVIVTPLPNPSVPPTWTPLPANNTPVPTDTALPSDTPPPATPLVFATEDPACDTWRAVQVDNQEDFAGGAVPIIKWAALDAASAYGVSVVAVAWNEVVNTFVEPSASPDAEAAFLSYEIAPDVLGAGGFGYGWEVTPLGDQGALCYGISGEFSYSP